jgi:hypothetical protein
MPEPDRTYHDHPVHRSDRFPDLFVTEAAALPLDSLSDLAIRIFARCAREGARPVLRSRTNHPTDLFWDRRGLDDGTPALVVCLPEERRP